MKKKTHKVQIRMSEYDRNKIQMFADRYADGNLSAWLIHGGHNAPRVKLETKKKKD